MNAARICAASVTTVILGVGCWQENHGLDIPDSDSGTDNGSDSDADSDTDTGTDTATEETPENDFWKNGYLGTYEDTNGDTVVDIKVPCSYDCKNIDYVGCCYGDVTLFCDISNDGETPALFCHKCPTEASPDLTCGWRVDISYYWCGVPGNVDFRPAGDPTGEHAMDCEEFSGVPNPLDD